MSASSDFTGKSFRPKGTPTEITSGTGTFTPPVDGTWYRYTITSAGGGGGAGDTVNGGGGGGAGATRRGIIKIPIAGFAYVVPAGGAAGAAGGSVTLGRIVVTGGQPGGARSVDLGKGGNGGGVAAISATNPTLSGHSSNVISYVPEGVTPGGAGADSFAVSGATSGIAMPAGYPLAGMISTATGISGSVTPTNEGGRGGSSEFGDGGAGGANDAVGGNATGYGGGGGGGGKAASGTRAGGTGSGGRIYLEPLGVW